MEALTDKTHESYGLIQFNRMSSNAKQDIFGSEANTTDYIRLTVTKNAHVEDYDGAHRRFYNSAKMADEVVQLDMTFAQFATLITSMNYGTGIPCSIRRIGGKKMEPVPVEMQPDNLVDIARETVRRKMSETAANVAQLYKEMTELFNSKHGTLKISEKTGLLKRIAKLEQDLKLNIPYFTACAGETIDRIEERAKLELSALVTNYQIKAGVKALDLDTDFNEPKQITD